MAYVGDFLVEDAVMKRYIGVGGDIVIPDCVKEIGESSFLNCNAVTSAVLPEGVEKISYAAFSWRTGLLSIELPHSLRHIEEGAFEGCTGIKNIVIPEGVRQIDVAAFYGCENLESIQIPHSLESYEDFIEANSMCAIIAPDIALGDIPEKYRIHAVHGLAYCEQENADIRAEYMEYIRANTAPLCRRAEKSMPLLQFLMREELIDFDSLEAMLSKAIEKKDFELTASLLDYQGKIMRPEKLRQRAQQEKAELDELWEF